MRLLPACAFLVGLTTALAEPRYGEIPIEHHGLLPRFYLEGSFPLAKRDSSCASDTHSCLDIGVTDQCCENDSYCYINKEGKAKCCPIGSNCSGDSLCKSEAYYCTTTATSDGTATTQAGCCGRKCPQTSYYLCPSDVGGNCCPFGAQCREGGKCIQTETKTTPPSLTPVVEGCTTSQHKCDDGDGCCDDWRSCTIVSGTAVCAFKPTDSNISVVEDTSSDSGMSDGAKAGIAVGAVVGSGLIIGFAVWLCLSRRRRRPRNLAGENIGPSVELSGRDDEMTEVSGVTGSRQQAPSRTGMTQDYFGPVATPGPYTETAAARANISTTTTSPGQDRAVPSQPHAPGDIAGAVEMDSTGAKHGEDGLLSPLSSPSIYATPASDTLEGRYELYGSEQPVIPQRSPSLLSSPMTPRSGQEGHPGL